jgi:SAM-dependent methyltransferase
MNLKQYANNIELKDGIWFSKNNSKVSYPDNGHENCYRLEENSFWFKHRNNCTLAAIKNFSPDKVFFDIGGGNGFVSAFLEKENIETVLLEPGINGIRNAKKRNLKNLICSILEEVAFKKECLPCAGLFDVLEHIEDDLAFLKELYSLMENEGALIITVPAYNLLWSGEDIFAGHFRRYTLKTLKLKLEKAGFKIEYQTYFFSILPFPIFLFRSLPYIFGKKNNNKEKYNNEHKYKGLLGYFLNKIWVWELKMISGKRKIPFGGSCLVVARKKD